MTESQELFEPSQITEDELIEQLLNEGHGTTQNNETGTEQAASTSASTSTTTNTEKPAFTRNTALPLTRIKALMKLDPDVGLLSSESIFLVSKATELFLTTISRETFAYTSKAKRKTVQKRDVDAAIENVDALCFLDGAMDGN